MRNTLFYTRNIFVNIRTQIHLFACLHLVAFPPCISILGIQPLSKCVLWCFAILPWCVVWSFYLGVYFLLAVLIRINERMISPLELWKTTYWPNPSCHEVSPKLAVRLAESWTCKRTWAVLELAQQNLCASCVWTWWLSTKVVCKAVCFCTVILSSGPANWQKLGFGSILPKGRIFGQFPRPVFCW